MASNPVELPRGYRLTVSIADQLQRLVSDSLGHQARIEIDEILQSVTRAIAREIPVTCMAMLLKTDPGTSRCVVHDLAHPAMAAHIDNFVAVLVRPGVAPTEGLTQRVIDQRGPLFLRSLPYDEFLTYCSPATRAHLVRSPYPMKVERVTMLMVPMHSGPATLGTLSMFDWLGSPDLREEDVDWMQALGDRVGLLVDSAQSRNRAIDRIERLNAISQAAAAITSSHDLRFTLDLILRLVIESLHVDAAQVLLGGETDAAYSVAASVGFRSAAAGEYKRDAGASAADSTRQWQRWIGAREGFRYHAASPLIVRDRIVGALEVLSRRSVEPDPEWTAFLDAMGSQTAIAVDNATMHQALLRAGPAQQRRPAPIPDLSPRDREIIRLIVEGATNREVAQKLFMSQSTVKFHIRRLLEKAGVSNRTELATRAVQQSWI